MEPIKIKLHVDIWLFFVNEQRDICIFKLLFQEDEVRCIYIYFFFFSRSEVYFHVAFATLPSKSSWKLTLGLRVFILLSCSFIDSAYWPNFAEKKNLNNLLYFITNSASPYLIMNKGALARQRALEGSAGFSLLPRSTRHS